MPTAPITKLNLLEAHDLQALARAPGPCVTITVPGFHPGETAGARAVVLRQLAQNAAVKLGKYSRSSDAVNVAASVEHLTGTVDEGHGGPGLTLFCAPGVECAYITPQVSKQVYVGGRFHLVPMIRVAMAPHDILALGLNQKHVRLWRMTSQGVAELPLPAGVPASLAEAGAYDRPDHTLENRSAATTARKRGVRFGTSSDHDDANEYMRKFMLLIAQGFHNAHRGVPVFLVGVREDLQEFRQAAKDHCIFEAEWHTNPEHCSPAEIEVHARAAANHEYYRRGVVAADVLRKAKADILSDPALITSAARQGRVHRLFIAEQAEYSTDVPPETGIHPGEDLLNLATAETLGMGGEAWTFPGSTLAAVGIPESPIAASLRY